MQKFSPIWDRLLVEPCNDDAVTSGGIVISGSGGEGVSYGIVVAIGDGYREKSDCTMPFSVKVGDKIVYWTGLGAKMRLNGNDHVVLTESQLIGKMEEVSADGRS